MNFSFSGDDLIDLIDDLNALNIRKPDYGIKDIVGDSLFKAFFLGLANHEVLKIDNLSPKASKELRRGLGLTNDLTDQILFWASDFIERFKKQGTVTELATYIYNKSVVDPADLQLFVFFIGAMLSDNVHFVTDKPESDEQSKVKEMEEELDFWRNLFIG